MSTQKFILFTKCATIEKRLPYSFSFAERLVIVGSESFKQVLGRKSKEKSSKILHIEGGWGEGQGHFGGKIV